mmetsp:Transcript_9508/g.14332  ORF Transcript_9508/g.14332 Transcript_9508/m.14332 type:complete len:225 (-) Transcript_9508:19-693(-)
MHCEMILALNWQRVWNAIFENKLPSPNRVSQYRLDQFPKCQCRNHAHIPGHLYPLARESSHRSPVFRYRRDSLSHFPIDQEMHDLAQGLVRIVRRELRVRSGRRRRGNLLAIPHQVQRHLPRRSIPQPRPRFARVFLPQRLSPRITLHPPSESVRNGRQSIHPLLVADGARVVHGNGTFQTPPPVSCISLHAARVLRQSLHGDVPRIHLVVPVRSRIARFRIGK